MTSVSAGHIILAPTLPVGSRRPQWGSDPGPPHQDMKQAIQNNQQQNLIVMVTSLDQPGFSFDVFPNAWEVPNTFCLAFSSEGFPPSPAKPNSPEDELQVKEIKSRVRIDFSFFPPHNLK